MLSLLASICGNILSIKSCNWPILLLHWGYLSVILTESVDNRVRPLWPQNRENIMKLCITCGSEDVVGDGENHCRACQDREFDCERSELSTKQTKSAAYKSARRQARERHQALLDCGLVRVRGALGGIYYE